MSTNIREQAKNKFWSVYWICPECHQCYPYDYDDDWCEQNCDSRLRRNDDVRLYMLKLSNDEV